MTLQNLSSVTSGLAVAYGRDGIPYINQEMTPDGRISSSAPSNEDDTSPVPYRMVRDIFVNSAQGSGLPYNQAIYANNPNWKLIIDDWHGQDTEFQNRPFSDRIQDRIQNVVTCQGDDRKCHFKFLKVTNKIEAAELLKALKANIPNAEQVKSYVEEAIYLSKVRPLSNPQHESTGYAPKNVMGFIRFYWLQNEQQKLHLITENSEYLLQPAHGKDLLVTYPNHPDAQDEKVIASACLLKEIFELRLNRKFDAVHINQHPITIQEPNTITSNLPPPYDITSNISPPDDFSYLFPPNPASSKPKDCCVLL